MNVEASLQDVDALVEDVFGRHAAYRSKRTGRSRRNAYGKTLEEVKRIADDGAARELLTWIEAQITERETLPTSRRVRREGARICRARGHSISASSWLGA